MTRDLFCVFKLLNLVPKKGCTRSETRSSFAVSRLKNSCVIYNKICCSHDCQIKPRILELSIRRSQSSYSIVSIIFFVSCKEKDCYVVISAGQLSLTAARIVGTATLGIKQIIFSQFYFSIFESGGITKHLLTGPSGNSEFCFPWDHSLSP